MKLTIEPTGRMETVNGELARVWTGTTDKGVKVTCWISIVRVHKDDDSGDFERELREVKVERELVSFDMRMV